jgi:hypothetical protein
MLHCNTHADVSLNSSLGGMHTPRTTVTRISAAVHQGCTFWGTSLLFVGFHRQQGELINQWLLGQTRDVWNHDVPARPALRRGPLRVQSTQPPMADVASGIQLTPCCMWSLIGCIARWGCSCMKRVFLTTYRARQAGPRYHVDMRLALDTLVHASALLFLMRKGSSVVQPVGSGQSTRMRHMHLYFVKIPISLLPRTATCKLLGPTTGEVVRLAYAAETNVNMANEGVANNRTNLTSLACCCCPGIVSMYRTL